MTHTKARPLIQLLIPGVAVLLAACGGAAPASAPASPSVASTVAKPASASAAEAAKPSAPAVTTVPAKLLQQYHEAVNRGDVAAVMALFADDAVYVAMPLCIQACVGKPAIQKDIERGIGDHNQLHLIDVQTNGNVATSHTDWRSDATRRAGVDRRIVIETVEERGSKIGSYSKKDDVSDPETAKFQAFQQQQAGASAKPAGSAKP